jgi:ferrous iron transport protein A
MSAAVPDQLGGFSAFGFGARRDHVAAGTLRAAAAHVSVTIRDVAGDPVVCQRLLELGFTPGQPIAVMAAAPFGGPLAVTLRGTILAIRREEAACIRL